MDNESSNDFFCEKPVEKCCDSRLRIIFDTLLLEKKVKQQGVADTLSLDKAYISRIFNGVENPPLRVKLKIAEFFGVDSALIWRGEK